VKETRGAAKGGCWKEKGWDPRTEVRAQQRGGTSPVFGKALKMGKDDLEAGRIATSRGENSNNSAFLEAGSSRAKREIYNCR